MRKKEWIYITLVLFATWGLDRVTKMWASTLTDVTFHGIFGFALHHNHGAMLGLFSDLPAVLRIVSLSTGGAFLLFVFFLIQYMLPIKSMNLRMGLAILIGGILGNVADRILYGYVIDFLIIGNDTISTAVFNVADAVQWVAYLMVVWSLFKEGELLWPENNRRGRLWINPAYQLKYCIMLVATGIGFSLISGVYSYTYLKVALGEILGPTAPLLQRYIIPFTITFVIISSGFALIMFLVGRKLSHKTVGPLHAFETFLEDIMNGKKRTLKLRTGDEFPQLESIAEKISSEFTRLKELADNKEFTERSIDMEDTQPMIEIEPSKS